MNSPHSLLTTVGKFFVLGLMTACLLSAVHAQVLYGSLVGQSRRPIRRSRARCKNYRHQQSYRTTTRCDADEMELMRSVICRSAYMT